jgi:peptidoglycan/LPS O-acetylase OafA/YrhL
LFLNYIKYRPELDGLRAVAVFAVIIYHANFVLFGWNLFQGGFIGVDIFFVISGYLITTLILKEFFYTNKFSFKYFYYRRIRRILPVLLFVTIITSIISYFILLPESLIDFGKSILSIIFFGSNFYFWFTGERYGAENTLIKPLLHTWSLSVEEQFYILFPIFLIITLKFFRKYFTLGLFLIFLISLLFAEYSSKMHPSFNFYILLSRGFELLIGSLLSYFKLNNQEEIQKQNSILNLVCPSFGIILIFFSFLFFNFTKIFHPSFITLIPLLGVSLVIWFSKKGELITEILSSRIFSFFGLISYSLYLWHYPIFAFLRYIDVFNNSIWIKLFSILVTIIISILSFYFIERPFRNKKIITVKKLTVYVLICSTILLSYSFYILEKEGIKKRFPDIIFKPLRHSIGKIENSNNSNFRNVLLIGDSHANALYYELNEALKIKNYNLHAITKDGKLFVENINLYRQNKSHLELDVEHMKYVEDVRSFIKSNNNLIIIYYQSWLSYLSQHFEPEGFTTNSQKEREIYLSNALVETIKNIANSENKLILINHAPVFEKEVPKEALKNYTVLNKLGIGREKFNINIVSIETKNFYTKYERSFRILDSVESSNIYRVYPHKLFCDTFVKLRCVGNTKENIFFYDTAHLSLDGSKLVVKDIMKLINEIDWE